ncbi:MAG: gliding motility protein GldC [Raineya sp.]|nr:gliding motility protein GldC [Raineya sp.]
MRKETITLNVTLDENNVCEQIHWDATQKPQQGLEQAKAIALSIWDGWGKGTLKIDLWTKEMEVMEMKRFCIETISGLADTIRIATGDEIMAMEMENICKRMQDRLEAELKQMQQIG